MSIPPATDPVDYWQGFRALCADVHAMRFDIFNLPRKIDDVRTTIASLDRTIGKVRAQVSSIETTIKTSQSEPTILTTWAGETPSPGSCLVLAPGTALSIDDIVQFSRLLPPDAYYSCEYNKRPVQIRFDVSRFQVQDATGVKRTICDRVSQVFQIPVSVTHDDIWSLCIIKYMGQMV